MSLDGGQPLGQSVLYSAFANPGTVRGNQRLSRGRRDQDNQKMNDEKSLFAGTAEADVEGCKAAPCG